MRTYFILKYMNNDQVWAVAATRLGGSNSNLEVDYDQLQPSP
jgi:hypothetical protein